MCGISGIIAKQNHEFSIDQVINQMNDLIIHRGPDAEGIYINQSIGLGHRRLAIIDLHENANQPFIKEQYILVFNGEIYNYRELREELCDFDYRTDSDTEVIIAAYEKWGTECVNHFRGMWAFLLYDKSKNIIFGSRDRFGIKPFYIYNTAEYLAFASEIKQFTVLPNWKAKMNMNRVQDFIVFGALDHTEETMFDNVNQLRGGYNLEYHLGEHTLSIYQYYDLKEQLQEQLDDEFDDAKEKVYKHFKEAVLEHLVADVKVGSCLSGGIDSSSIVTMAEQLIGEDIIETVSSCFENKAYDEQQYIDEILKSDRIKGHKVFPQVDNLLEKIEELVWHQDEPFGSTSIFAQREVFRIAKENNIKVMLDGQGADEQLMGYHSFYQAFFSQLYLENKEDTLHKALKKYQEFNPSFTDQVFEERCVKQHKECLKDTLEQRLKRPERMLKPEFNTYYDYYQGLNEAMTSAQLLSIHQLEKSSLPQLLHYEDRNSMTYSIESRVPFLDHRFVEYVCSLPTTYKLDPEMTKIIFREAMDTLLPEIIKNRKDKMGFVTPEVIWIKEHKQEFRKHFAKGCEKLKGIIDKKKALEWFDEHINSAKIIDFTIWRIVCVGIWIDVFDIQCE